MNTEELKDLRNKIHTFSSEKQLEIFKMCKSKDIFYTENSNGIFINMSELTSSQISELKKYVDYITEQEQELELAEKEKKEMTKIFAQAE